MMTIAEHLTYKTTHMCVWVFYSQKYIPKAKETDPATKYLHNLPYHSLTAHTYCLAYFVRSIIFYTRIRSPSRACSLEATIGNPPKISLFSFLWSWHIFTVAFFAGFPSVVWCLNLELIISGDSSSRGTESPSSGIWPEGFSSHPTLRSHYHCCSCCICFARIWHCRRHLSLDSSAS